MEGFLIVGTLPQFLLAHFIFTDLAGSVNCIYLFC